MSSASITREMGLSHRDFFRTLPGALEGRPFQVSGTLVSVAEDHRRLTIRLDPEAQRRIAGLRLPVTRVHFAFENYRDEEIDAFMRHFERRFQRGGG